MSGERFAVQSKVVELVLGEKLVLEWKLFKLSANNVIEDLKHGGTETIDFKKAREMLMGVPAAVSQFMSDVVLDYRTNKMDFKFLNMVDGGLMHDRDGVQERADGSERTLYQPK